MAEYNDQLCEHYRSKVDDHDTTVNRLTVCVERLTTISENQERQTSDLDARLKQIENRPSKIIDKVIIGLITAVVSALVSILINGVI